MPARTDMPRNPDYGHGVYRRRIRIETLERRGTGGRVAAVLEDDFHHVRAEIDHDGRKVTRARGETLRIPWATCPGAVEPLRSLAGTPLSPSIAEIARTVDLWAQCTHLFDAAVLAVSLAARGDAARIYDASVPDRREGRTRVALARDGEMILEWQLDGLRILDPAPYAGRSLTGDFAVWCAEHLDLEQAEAAQVLRRALFIGLGRQYDFEAIPAASGFASVVGGACHTFQPERVREATRVAGSVRDWTSADPADLARGE